MGEEGFKLERISDKKPNAREAWEIILLVIGLVVVGFFRVNTTLWQVAETFWFLGLTALLGIIVALVVSKLGVVNFGVPISESSIMPVKRRYLAAVAVIVGLATFFFISQTSYTVQMPTFQILDPGLGGTAILDFFAAIFENALFFILIPGIVFTVVYYASGIFSKGDDNQRLRGIIALVIVLISVPIIFTVYHTGTYGFENIPATTAVFVFGFEMTAWMLLMRDSLYVHARHIGNNLGILVFSSMTIETFFVELMSNWVVWLVGFLVALAIIIKIIRK